MRIQKTQEVGNIDEKIKYLLTAATLIASVGAVSAKQYFGNREPDNWLKYCFRKGDTMSRVLQRFNPDADYRGLIDEHNLPVNVQTGQEVVIPIMR